MPPCNSGLPYIIVTGYGETLSITENNWGYDAGTEISYVLSDVGRCYTDMVRVHHMLGEEE